MPLPIKRVHDKAERTDIKCGVGSWASVSTKKSIRICMLICGRKHYLQFPMPLLSCRFLKIMLLTNVVSKIRLRNTLIQKMRLVVLHRFSTCFCTFDLQNVVFVHKAK